MPNKKTHDLIANGRKRAFESEEYKKAYEEIRAKVAAKYQDRYAQAGFLKRLLIRMRMEREIQQELEKIAPRDAMYLKAGSHTESSR